MGAPGGKKSVSAGSRARRDGGPCGDGDSTSARPGEPPRSDQNERRHEYRRRLIAVKKSWRDAQVAILFGKTSRKAAFATNDSGRYWRLSGASQSWGSASGVLAITRGPESKMSAAGAQSDST